MGGLLHSAGTDKGAALARGIRHLLCLTVQGELKSAVGGWLNK